MVNVSIIGSGNVGQHLARAFESSTDAQLIQVYARNRKAIENIVSPDKIISELSELKPADLYIIAVSDSAIAEISQQLPFNGRLVCHTSGSVSLSDADPKNNRGVFYPLQTFSKNKPVDFTDIPLCLECESDAGYEIMKKTASAISNRIYAVDSNQRKAIHVAAVFVNNFVNHLYAIGGRICDENNVPFEILQTLIRETADKIHVLKPAEAQTGPAVRNDQQTIEKHLEFLGNTEYRKIYELLTKSIQNGRI